jgi:hypothetical protein
VRPTTPLPSSIGGRSDDHFLHAGLLTVSTIDRREAIRRVSVLLGGVALVGESGLWAACSRSDGARAAAAGSFTPADITFLDEVAETMLPETQTPGAKAAGVGPFMALMVTECYEESDQRIFRRGMQQLDEASERLAGRSFLSATPAARLTVLEALDREQKTYMDAKKPDEPSHYFRMMKELVLLGYFTSEIGCTKAQRYIESPGRYDPCVSYEKGTPAWAEH